MRRILQTLLALAGCAALWAQGPGRLPMRAFGNREGLESTTINALLQDERGLLWVGTEVGLHRFDGRAFHQIQVPLPSRMVLSLAAEGPRLWVGTRNGLALLEAERPVELPSGSPKEERNITHLQSAPGSRVWFLANGIPWSGDARALAPAAGWPQGTVATGLVVDREDGAVLACSVNRLWRYDGGEWFPLDAPKLGRGESLQSVARDGDGWLWLRSSLGAWYRPAAGPWRFRSLAPAGGFPIIEGLGRNRDGSLWISTGVGLAQARGSRFEALPVEGLGDLGVATVDREGSLWIGATGLFQVMGRGLWRYWNHADGLPSPLTWQVLEDGQHRKWAASDAGLALGTATGWKTVQRGRFLRLALTPDGALWAGCTDASLLYRIAPGSSDPRLVPLPKDLPPGATMDSLAAQGDRLWMVGGDRLWLGRVQGPTLVWEAQAHPAVGYLRKVLEDGHGGVFLSGDKGLFSREGEAWVRVPGLAEEQVLGLALSADGLLAVGYFDNPRVDLLRRVNGAWALQRTLDPLPKDGKRVIYAMAFDRRQRLWVGTSKGLLRVATEGTAPPIFYEEGEGLTGSDISHQSLFFDGEGRLWVCSATAICRYDAEAEPGDLPLPAPVVLEARQGTRDLPLDGRWDLRVGDRLQVGFAMPTYLRPESLRFHALLDDGSRTVVLDLERPFLDLPSLDARSYRITLLGRLPDRGMGPGTTLEVVVHPPFWASPWAFVGYVVVGILMAGGLHRWRQSRLSRRATQLEDLVAQRTEELTLASRAKSAFLANMSHELRTPLNAILLYSELMQEEAKEAGHGRELADARKIHAAGRHLLGLIDDILDLSKIEAGRMNLDVCEIDIPSFLADLDHALRPLVEKKGNRLLIHPSPDLLRMRTDPTRLRQILSNLLSNAGKFTETGLVELQTRKVEHEAVFIVRDTGIGMSDDQVRRVFEEFVQADASTTRRFGGTGLGLALVRHLSQLLGGEVDVDSRVGQGSTFTVRIPLEHPSAT